MTDRKQTKRRKFAHQILGLIGISALLAVILFGVLFGVLSGIAAVVVDEYCFYNDVVMTEFDWMKVDAWIFSISTAVSALFFSLLFLGQLSQRMGYIRRLTDGYRQGQTVPVEGNNELTELAQTINGVSAVQQQLREREQALAREKEELIRTLSHDIRTPLTSVLAYSEMLAEDASLPPQKREQLQTIRTKAQQIQQLTQILLDGSHRQVERFEDACLLMEQLAAGFEEELEAQFQVCTDLRGCEGLAGSFDVQELRRIFDNLSSNACKYADPALPVELTVGHREGALVICQSNAIRQDPPQADSYKLGLSSIRRIAQHYGGSVAVENDGKNFAITIVLAEI